MTRHNSLSKQLELDVESQNLMPQDLEVNHFQKTETFMVVADEVNCGMKTLSFATRHEEHSVYFFLNTFAKHCR